MYFQLVESQALSTRGQPDVNLHTPYLAPLADHHHHPGVVAQAQTNQGFKLKALLSLSQSNFENGSFQAGVELAPRYLGRGEVHL